MAVRFVRLDLAVPSTRIVIRDGGLGSFASCRVCRRAGTEALRGIVV